MLKDKLKYNVGNKPDDTPVEIITDRDKMLIEKRKEKIMIPDTETQANKFKREYPNAEWNCSKIAYNVDYNVPDLTGIYRHTPIECTIDNQRRNCEGKCGYYKKSLLRLFFGL